MRSTCLILIAGLACVGAAHAGDPVPYVAQPATMAQPVPLAQPATACGQPCAQPHAPCTGWSLGWNLFSRKGQGQGPACPCPTGTPCAPVKASCVPCAPAKPVCAPCPPPKPVCTPCVAPKPVCTPCVAPKPVCTPCVAPKPVCAPCAPAKPACAPCAQAQPTCGTGCGHARFARLKAWFGYRDQGNCGKDCQSCKSGCHSPLYLLFLRDCAYQPSHCCGTGHGGVPGAVNAPYSQSVFPPGPGHAVGAMPAGINGTYAPR